MVPKLDRRIQGSRPSRGMALNGAVLRWIAQCCSHAPQVVAFLLVRGCAASWFTPKRSLVRSQYRPPQSTQLTAGFRFNGTGPNLVVEQDRENSGR